MKKEYLSPEVEIEKFTTKSSILTTSGDMEIPGGDIDDPWGTDNVF